MPRRRAHVVDQNLEVQRQAALGNLTVKDGVDEHLLRPLRILDAQGDDFDVGGSRAQRGDGVGLVLLHTDGRTARPDPVADDLGAAHHRSRPFDHDPVVAGEIGLALTAVDHDELHALAFRHLELHVAGEGRAAETHQTRELYPIRHLRGRQAHRIDGGRLGQPLAVVGIGLDHDGGQGLAVGVEPGLDGRDAPRHRSVEGGRDEAARLADQLAAAQALPDPDDGLRRGAGVLGERQHVLLHERHALDGKRVGGPLALGRVDAVAEGRETAVAGGGRTHAPLLPASGFAGA
jgi:hypothetical protein